MKTVLALFISLTVLSARAGDFLAEFNWPELAKKGELSEGEPVTMDGRSALRIAKPTNGAVTVQLLKIKAPKISRTLYAIQGEIKYENIQGEGYLEMWNCFPGEKPGMPEIKAFTKTLDDSGDMGKITGTSNWREFMLPFDRTGSDSPPTRLEVNLVLPAGGTVYFGPLKLVQFPGNSFGPATVGAWWSDRAAAWIGAIAGSLLGCLGSLLEWLASKGRARAFVLGTIRVLIALGAVLGIIGFVAFLSGQPYRVWFVLLLLGVIDLAVLWHRLGRYQKRFEDLELRKMVAADVLNA